MLLQAVFPTLLWYLPPKKLLGHLRLNKTHWPDPWSPSCETDSRGSNPKPGSLARWENLGDECNHFMGYFEFCNFFFQKHCVYSVFEFSWMYKSILWRTLANIYCLKQHEIRTHLVGTPKEEHFYVFQLFFLPTIVLRTFLEKDFRQVSDGKPRKAF